MKPEKSLRIEDIPTTTSFVIRAGHVQWIAEQAKRRQVSKAEVMRELIDRAMAEAAEIEAMEASAA